MSASLVCPYCGHSPPPNRARMGTSIHCERCQRVFTPVASTPPPFDPFVKPELVTPEVEGMSNPTAFLAIFVIVGIFLLLCGGLGGYIAINARPRIVAKANEIEEIQRQRQVEMQPNPLPKKAQPPQPIRKQVPREVQPEIKLPPSPPRVIPQPDNIDLPPKKSRPSRPPSAPKSVDDLLAELNDSANSRPAWATLQELARLPVQENRKVDVAPALTPHLQSSDTNIASAAARAANVWGTEQNGDALLALIDSPHAILRWEAMRALAKVRPTAETAELLLAQAGEASNGSALRDAFKVLGSIGEQTLLESLVTDDRRAKQTMLRLLGDTGTKDAIPTLEKMIASESDFMFRSQAEHALRKIRERNP